ncbi:helix-turn-helix transcriptional regulator [Microbacterium sp. A84]|uniref:helix-turn-helix transcriptional regulator n=1 Tax=Microbacterium sp. A84 TaxID=3450715 RepID=UPI003F43382C
MENTSPQNPMTPVATPRRTASTGRRHSSTRELVLRMVEAQSAPVSTRAIAAESGLHENTVRGHLEHLLADGYVSCDSAPAGGRGRPRRLWSARIDSAAAPYAALAVALAASLAQTSTEPEVVARAAGRAWGARLAADAPPAEDGDAAHRAVVEVMREQGFAPHDDGDVVRLRRCPLIEAAVRHPSIVCTVHLGMVDGVLDRIGHSGEVSLSAFTAPNECTLRLNVAS